jgi:uncharacterized membrane protein YjjB (DUF3815 family)
MDWLIVEKSIWFGFAAVGFAVLFNVPVRTLIAIFCMGMVGGLTKFGLIHYGFNIILASLAAAIIIGVLSISFAHIRHAPPPVFAIPSVIPLVPGILAYRMMLGLIKLAGDLPKDASNQALIETVNNGLKVMFILMSIAVGVAIPMLLTRKESAKHIRLPRNIFLNDN